VTSKLSQKKKRGKRERGEEIGTPFAVQGSSRSSMEGGEFKSTQTSKGGSGGLTLNASFAHHRLGEGGCRRRGDGRLCLIWSKGLLRIKDTTFYHRSFVKIPRDSFEGATVR